MSKYLEGMSEYDKGFVDGNRAKEALQAELKAQIEREARISELNRTKRTIAMGLSRDLMMLDIFDRIKELESE